MIGALLADPPVDPAALAGGIAERRTAADAVVDLLAPAQAELGCRWERGELSVDDGHRAAAVTDAVLAELGRAHRAPLAGTVMAACVPGEWHVLPARMANTVMHLAGWHVRFAGANTTPDRLRRQLRGDRPTALALSCIMPNHLPAACDLIAVAHDEGVPVLTGGRAFSARHSRRLGAEVHVGDAREAPAVLAGWLDAPPEPSPSPAPPSEEFATLVLEGDRVGHVVAARVAHALGDLSDTHRRQLEDGVRMLQEHLAAAVYLEDEAVFLDATVWAARLGEQRGFPRWAVVAGLGALEASLPSDLPCTRDYVAAAVATLEP